MRPGGATLSPIMKLDNALAELHLLSHGSGSNSSPSSSPLTSASSGVVSPVFNDYSTMSEQSSLGRGYVSRIDSYPYKSLERESSQLSPLHSDYSSGREFSQTNSLEKPDGSKMVSCTCCPYGKHQYEQSYRVKSAVVVDNGQHHSSTATDQRLGQDSTNTASASRRLFSMDSYGSEYSSPGSQLSPLSTSSDPYNQRSRVTKTTTTITSSNILPSTGEHESLTISPEAIQQIKEHTDRSNAMIKELQEQLKLIPQLQGRIRSLKEDKKQLSHQLQSKSGVSSMRSIGVGDFDVDEDHVIVERIKQTVTQEPAKAPVRSVGVGVYDVNTELYSQAEVLHTVAEHVQKIREKEIHSWIQEAEDAYEARKASTRSFGVGDKDIRDEENRLIREKEMRTILIGQKDKPAQRNVGLQVKPAMREVCIGHSVQDTKPSTRSCGVNVDISDIIQEMSSRSDVYGTLSPQQQQQNSWTLQKHVIQKKFMEAMTTGRQEDLVNFITGLLKRSVRSVGTTAKPSTVDHGTTTQFRTHDKGVSDDVTNVTVKPYVQTKDVLCTAKPATRTQPTWTDLLLTCDTGTNTQPYQHMVDKSVNTAPPEPSQESQVTTTVTKRHVIPPPSINKSSYYVDKSQMTKALPPQHNLYGDINRTVTETTMTEHRTTKTRPDVSRKYHSHVDKLMTPPPQPVELDITLPHQVTAERHISHREEGRRQVTRRTPLEEHHRTEMHMMLHGRAEPLSPVVVQMLPNRDGREITSSTHTLLANSPRSLDTCLSPKAHSVTSEHQTGYTVRSRSLSGDHTHRTLSPSPNLLIPKSSSTKRVVSEEKPYTTVKETTEMTESGDTVKKETTIERTFSSTSSSTKVPEHMTSSLSDFDYFGANYSGSKPKGHAERMERYGGSVTYGSTGANVNEERNKTEMHGNPLKSRYTIEEMSGGMSTAVSSQSTQSSNTKSLLRDKGSPRSKRINVKFADEQAESCEYGSEFAAACSVLQQHMDSGSRHRTPQVAEAENIIQEKWFDTCCARLSHTDSVNSMFNYLSTQHSPILLQLIINIMDGNGNTALHYAVSHANFDVVKVLLQTGMADVNIQNKAGYTPVMLAALCDASSERDRSALRLLLLNADVNIAASQAGQTALMLAVSHGRLEMVKLLLESNSDINLQDFDGSTALMCATEHNYMDIVKTLLAHPDVNVLLKELDDSTALDIALEKGHQEIAELLERAENTAKIQTAATERSVSRVIPSASKGGSSQRASSTTSSKSYTSRYV